MRRHQNAFRHRHFDIPQILVSDRYNHLQQLVRAPIVVLLLFRTTLESCAEILSRLEEGSSANGDVGKELQVVPWIRNTALDVEDVLFDIVRDGNDGNVLNTSFILIDEKGLEEGTCVISHFIWAGEGGNEDHEYARVKIEDAKRLVEEASKEKSWFEGTLDKGLQVQRVEKRQEEIAEEVIGREQWKWPAHLPEDLKLGKNELTVVSLIHLSDTEISQIQTDILSGEGSLPVTILNWPDGIEPASRADFWYIFDHIKPSWATVAPCGETFGLFIDSDYLAGPHRTPELFLACRKRVEEDIEDSDSDTSRIENSMELSKVNSSAARQVWAAVWSPTSASTSDNVVDNDSMRGLRGIALRPLAQVVVRPGLPAVFNELPIFILTPITPSQEYALRALICTESDRWYFLNVPGDLNHLVSFFQSQHFLRHNARPPHGFLAVDELTVSAIERGGQPRWLLATSVTVWHQFGEEELAQDEVGYVVGRAVMYEFDDYQTWAVNGWRLGRLESAMEGGGADDQDGAGRYYWDCFDVDDEELADLVGEED